MTDQSTGQPTPGSIPSVPPRTTSVQDHSPLVTATGSNVGDDQVESSRERVRSLESQVEEKKLQLAKSEASRNNAVRKETLDNYAQTLEAELARLDQAIQTSERSSQG